MEIELSSLNSQPSTSSNEILKEAAAKLCFTEYESFKSELLRGIKHYELKDVVDSDSENVIGLQVCSRRYPEAPPRVFLHGSNERCGCIKRVSNLRQCLHETLAFGFKEDMFQPMHMRRQKVMGSLNGWRPPCETVHSVDRIIGYEQEDVVYENEGVEMLLPTPNFSTVIKEM